MKIHFLHNHVNYFSKTWKPDGRARKVLPTRYENNGEKMPGTLEYQHDGKLLFVRKGNFRINNHALFYVMKKEYAIMFGRFLAF